MPKAIRSVREALERFEPDHDCWDSARLNMSRDDYPAIEQFYKHHEWLDYRWIFHYRLTKHCAEALIRRGLVMPDPRARAGEMIFNLAKKK